MTAMAPTKCCGTCRPANHARGGAQDSPEGKKRPPCTATAALLCVEEVRLDEVDKGTHGLLAAGLSRANSVGHIYARAKRICKL